MFLEKNREKKYLFPIYYCEIVDLREGKIKCNLLEQSYPTYKLFDLFCDKRNDKKN